MITALIKHVGPATGDGTLIYPPLSSGMAKVLHAAAWASALTLWEDSTCSSIHG